MSENNPKDKQNILWVERFNPVKFDIYLTDCYEEKSKENEGWGLPVYKDLSKFETLEIICDCQYFNWRVTVHKEFDRVVMQGYSHHNMSDLASGKFFNSIGWVENEEAVHELSMKIKKGLLNLNKDTK